MAERIQVELVDDIDGSPAQHTVTFALDGVTYEIDLNERHARQLRSVFDRYIEHARQPKPEPQTGPRQQERDDRRVRQANKQLTEQIRGAAQRTREHLNKKARDEAEHAAPAEPGQPEQALFEPPSDNQAGQQESPRVPAVLLPQFSSAVD
ncbi:histone-like nucleoid-structuring protein Lsr2 [Saccharopolyspora rosea]|uniref:Lsr2 family protein n=1 Tax=Saccharopolyspora rosea TaxID=524884 RepID=A0ABW3G0X0_9PSEU|nr:Lsr2 family protein [Saccharopolyspora rosea]